MWPGTHWQASLGFRPRDGSSPKRQTDCPCDTQRTPRGCRRVLPTSPFSPTPQHVQSSACSSQNPAIGAWEWLEGVGWGGSEPTHLRSYSPGLKSCCWHVSSRTWVERRAVHKSQKHWEVLGVGLSPPVLRLRRCEIGGCEGGNGARSVPGPPSRASSELSTGPVGASLCRVAHSPRRRGA